jgi:crossover junction endodeoxyribonuclease RuvC
LHCWYSFVVFVVIVVFLIKMIILGVDPGTIVMGYGIIDGTDSDVTLIAYGAIRTKDHSAIAEKLSLLYKELTSIIKKYKPQAVAVEQPFVAKNVNSALAVGRAQAVAILAAANAGLLSFEYTPAQVKQRVANYGASSKEQIQEMVRLQLGLQNVPEPNDAADALAVALCHLHEMHLIELLSRGK